MDSLFEPILTWKNRVLAISRYAISHMEAVKIMISGQVMTKLAYSNGKKYQRLFLLNLNNQTLEWKQCRSKSGKDISLMNIVQVSQGIQGFSFKNKPLDISEQQRCFSIKTEKKVLNLLCESEQQRNLWVRGLTGIVSLKQVGKDLFEAENQLNKALKYCYKAITRYEFKCTSQINEQNDYILKINKKYQSIFHQNFELSKELQRANQYVEEQFIKIEKLLKNFQAQEKAFLEKEEIFTETDRTQTQKVKDLEKKLQKKQKSLFQAQSSLRELKKQIKDSFHRKIQQKIKEYKNSKEVIFSYSHMLKKKTEDLQKQLALWQSVVHMYALPSFQANKPGKNIDLRTVLNYALDMMQQRPSLQMTQPQFSNILDQARQNLITKVKSL